MQQYAKVIVDVPTMQTNQPYDYAIPNELQDQLQVGMRVVVPFGNGQRQVQGFIVAIDEHADFEGKLKEIAEISDLKPVLDAELLDLSQWLANRTFSFRITCLQTMLPSMLRASYTRTVRIIDDVPEAVQARLFNGLDEIPFDPSADPEIIRTLLQLQRQKKVEFVYEVVNRVRKQTRQAVISARTFEGLEEARTGVRKGAKQQLHLLDYLETLIDQEPVFLKEAMTTSNLSRAIFKTGEKNGWLNLVDKERFRSPFAQEQLKRTNKLTLTDEQQAAVTQIDAQVTAKHATTFLIEGVTGSGKTEIYLQTIETALNQGRTALMLVPEIALTPQMVTRVRGRFGEKVAVLHSGLSDGERFDEWRRIERGQAQVVVGARSAVFAPLKNLGIVIMDEEHETSYKQDETPRYHAREVAMWRAKYHDCPVILGSATPSLESRARAQKNVYQLIRLKERVNNRPLPHVDIIDMRQAMRQNLGSDFSPKLLAGLKDRLQKKEQSVLLLNRRGFSSFVMCRDCGFVLKCPNCDISLTLHMDTHSMKCHYCGHEEAIPKFCPNCRGNKMRYYGTGTQKVETQLQEQLPDARILRMDVDTTRKKGGHAKILQKFGDHQADILLGTQMIAKGLDFPDVTLVGVINADTALGLPDFRASERTFELLTQVSGRAGRAEKPGEVFVQSFNPEHYAIQFAKRHDYEGFYRQEMAIRHRGHYPPYYFTVLITASHVDEGAAAKKMYEIMQQLRPQLSPNAIVLGPTPKSIARVNNRYFYQIVIKYKQEPNLHACLEMILDASQRDQQHGFRIAIDHDPLTFT